MLQFSSLFWGILVFLSCLFESTKELQHQQPTLVQKLHEIVRAGNVDQFVVFLSQYFANDSNVQNETGWTCLQVASYHGSQALVEHLLQDDRLVLNQRNFAGETALHLASRNGYALIVEALIKAAKMRQNFTLEELVEAEQPDAKWTPLFYAANAPEIVEGVANAVKVLINLGSANTSREDFRGMMAVEVALASRRLDVARILLDHPSYKPRRQTGQKSLSHFAAEYNLVDFLRQFPNIFNASATDRFGQTSSCYAASNGSVLFGLEMLARGMKVHQGQCVYLDNKNQQIIGSPLHAAAYHRRKSYVEMLLRQMRNVGDLKDSRGGTAVHAMAWKASPLISPSNDHDILQLLFDNSREIVDTRDNDGNTPFLLAAITGAVSLGKLLRVKFPIDPNVFNAKGLSAIHLATTTDFLELLWPTHHFSGNVDLRTKNGGNYTPLLSAVSDKKSVEIISFFLNRKADPNAVNTLGQNALHLAVEKNNLEALQWFANVASFNFSRRDNEGRTPFLLAIHLNRVDAAKITLGSNGFKWEGEIMFDTLDSPLHIAARLNHHEMAKLLVDTLPSFLTYLNKARQTALHTAVESQNLRTLNVILGSDGSSGSGLTLYRDQYGRTPLHVSTLSCDNLRIVERLLEHIESVNLAKTVREIRDNFGETPVESAIRRNCITVVKRLLYFGAGNDSCSTLMTRQGITPLHLAKMIGHEKMVDEMAKTRRCSYDQVDSCEISVRTMSEEVAKIHVCSEILPIIRHSTFILPRNGDESFCVGSTRRFQCERGSELKGSDLVECGKTGNWIVSGYCDDTVAVELQRQLGELAADGNFSEIRRLVGLGYLDVNWVDPNTYNGDCGDWFFERSALMRAISCKRDVKIIAYLIDNGAEIKPDALIAASGEGPIETVRLLLDKGVDLLKKSYPALPEAIYSGHVDIVQLLLDRGAMVNPPRPGVTTALMAAAQRGDLETARMLLNRGADMNLRTNLAETDGVGDTALMTAAYFGKDSIVRLLIERGAKIDDITEALHSAVISHGKMTTVKLLLDNGANVSTTSFGYNGESILMSASDVGIAELLLDTGADVNARDRLNNTALIHAAFNKLKDQSLVELLLNRGADVNAVNLNGDSALSVAAFQNRPDLVQLLIKRGADRSNCEHPLCS